MQTRTRRYKYAAGDGLPVTFDAAPRLVLGKMCFTVVDSLEPQTYRDASPVQAVDEHIPTSIASSQSSLTSVDTVRPTCRRRERFAKLMGEYRVRYAATNHAPCGLVNHGNMCYLNVVLQPLLNCPPFVNLMADVYDCLEGEPSDDTPLIDALSLLVHRVSTAKGVLSPDSVYDAVCRSRSVETARGTQEDAEEFLGFLLDGLSSEFAKSVEQDGEWHKVGTRTRSVAVPQTPITRIFGGILETTLRLPGKKTSILEEPFLVLQLNICTASIYTVEDALDQYFAAETIEYPLQGRLVQATRHVQIGHLPPVVVVALKRSVFSGDCVDKLTKHVAVPLTLDFSKHLKQSAPEYRLFAIVNHHGRAADGGHYTCDILEHGKMWLHIDDTDIYRRREADVILERTVCDAYILLYECQSISRVETVRQYDNGRIKSREQAVRKKRR